MHVLISVSVTFLCCNFKLCCLLFIRMDWPELLDHPFWAQVLLEEEGREGEEEDEEEELDQEETISCEGVVSTSVRWVD